MDAVKSKIEIASPELEEKCQACDGSGREAAGILCESCAGLGFVPTDAGDKLLSFLRRHLGVGRDV